jgi:hypothetical protein
VGAVTTVTGGPIKFKYYLIFLFVLEVKELEDVVDSGYCGKA